MKNVMIIDDEKDARDLLRLYITENASLSIIGEASDGVEAVTLINNLKPDVVFLDIEMPGLSGFEVIEKLDDIPIIIFSTAYDNFAVNAFELNALDYLLKPYGRTRVQNTINRLLHNHITTSIESISLSSNVTQFKNKIILNKGARKTLVNIADITYAQAYGDYTKVFTTHGEYLSLKGISSLLDNLDKNYFIRLHRSFFANREFMAEVIKSDRYYYAIMKNKKRIKISESYAGDVRYMFL